MGIEPPGEVVEPLAVAAQRVPDPIFLWPWTRPYNEVSGKMTAREMADKVHEAALRER